MVQDTGGCGTTRSEIDSIVLLDCTFRLRPAQRPSYGTKDGRTMTTYAMSILNVSREARCNVVNGTPEHEEKSASHCLEYLTRHYRVTKNKVKEVVQASSLMLYDST